MYVLAGVTDGHVAAPIAIECASLSLIDLGAPRGRLNSSRRRRLFPKMVIPNCSVLELTLKHT
jgi:hypothetical protein